MLDNRNILQKKEIETNIEGQSLENYVKDRNFLEPEEIYSITLTLCNVISNMKNINTSINSIQLKPSNIILTENKRVSLIHSDGLNLYKDFYSLGLIMYFMVKGRVPFTVLEPILDDNYTNNIDDNLIRIIKKCFEIDIKNQYISIEELSKDISIMLLKENKYRKTIESSNFIAVNNNI